MTAHVAVFIIVAFLAVFSAVMVITSGNPVHSVIWLILNLVSLAVMYLSLNAPFLMAVQLIVYAGAIVVLFLFVVMLLGSKGEARGHPVLGWLRPSAIVAGGVLLACLVALATRSGAPAGTGAQDALIGDPAAIGRILYTTWLLPFEATSILLLAALVGALYLGRHGEYGTAEDYLPTEDQNG